MQAAVTALKIARLCFTKSNFESITIRTDSLNLIAFNSYLQRLGLLQYDWAEVREHYKTQFTECIFGSMVHYEADFDELFEAMEDLGRVPVYYQKVKSHSNNFGNDKSDALSKVGLRLPFDSIQLLESMKRSLNSCKSLLSYQARKTLNYSQSEFKQQRFLEILYVPMHFTDTHILKLFPAGKAVIVCSKNQDMKVTRDIVLRTGELSIYAQYMDSRVIQVDEFISCPVNPGIIQCAKCLQLGDHTKNHCPQGSYRCASCSKWGHGFKKCLANAKKLNIAVQDVCGNCKDKKLDDAHSVFSNCCPLRKQLQEKAVKEFCLRRKRFAGSY